MRRIRAAAIVCMALALGACAPAAGTREAGPARVWPAAPAEPRIAFVKAFSRPEDLGIAKGFLQRLADVVFGASDARLIRPMAVVTAGGAIYVADPGANGVHRFDTTSGEYALVRGEGGSALRSPVGLARGGAGEVYVTDSALAEVFVIRPGAKHAVPLRLSARLRQPTGIAFDGGTGRLYVVDTTAHRVMAFGPGGTLESSFGGRGAAPGEFNYPTLLWRSSAGRLYVTDSLNFRTQVFDERGRFLAGFGRLGDGTGDLARQKGVATDRHGHVYVVDALFHALQIFDPAGRFLLSVGGPGRDRGEFWLPTGIFIDADDTIYVADSFNQRVQVFRYIGGET